MNHLSIYLYKEILIYSIILFDKPMDSKLFLIAVAIVAAFGIAAAAIGPVSIATPVLAQGNMTMGDNMTAGNMTMGDNMTMGG
jgi:hypothetical protein